MSKQLELSLQVNSLQELDWNYKSGIVPGGPWAVL